MRTEAEKRKIQLFFGGLAALALIINILFLSFGWGHSSHTPVQQQFVPQPQQQPALQSIQLQLGPDTKVAAREAAEAAAAKQAAYLARYLNPGFVRKPGVQTIAVAVVGEDGKFDRAVGAAIADRFKTNTVQILTSFFRSEFVADGLFTDALASSSDVFTKLELAKSVDVVLLGRQEVQYSTDPSLENVVTANMRLEITEFSVADGNSRSWMFVANGAGFKQSEARLMAEERLIKQISTDPKLSLSL